MYRLLVLFCAFNGFIRMTHSSECSSSGFICVDGTNVQQCVDDVPQGPEIGCGHGFVCDANGEPGPCVRAPVTCCSEGTFSVPGNCRLFTICKDNGRRKLQFDGSCANGYEFSSQQLKCLPIDEAECSIRSDDNTTTQASTTTTKLTTPRTTTTTTKSPSFRCTAPGQFTDPTSCRHYMICTWVTGTKLQATRAQCVANLVYDTSLRQCVYTTNCGSRPK